MAATQTTTMRNMITTSLSLTVADYLRHLGTTAGRSQSTLRMRRTQLGAFLATTGDLPVDQVMPEHVDAFLAGLAEKGRGGNTIAAYIAALSGFFGWLNATALRGRDLPDPMIGAKAPKVMRRKFTIVPPEEWAHLLNVAGQGSPRMRAVFAIGLYHGLRDSEIRELRVGDMSDDMSRIDVLVEKSKLLSPGEPVVTELQGELRRWLGIYEKMAGRPLRPTDYLVPMARPFSPERKSARLVGSIKLVLNRCGYSATDEHGRGRWDGVHTLRRSFAAARYLDLMRAGRADALDIVSKLLHHANTQVTWGYIRDAVGSPQIDRLYHGRSAWQSAPPADTMPPGVVVLRGGGRDANTRATAGAVRQVRRTRPTDALAGEKGPRGPKGARALRVVQ